MKLNLEPIRIDPNELRGGAPLGVSFRTGAFKNRKHDKQHDRREARRALRKQAW